MSTKVIVQRKTIVINCVMLTLVQAYYGWHVFSALWSGLYFYGALGAPYVLLPSQIMVTEWFLHLSRKPGLLPVIAFILSLGYAWLACWLCQSFWL